MLPNMRLFAVPAVQSRVVAWLTESVSTKRSFLLTLETRMWRSWKPRQVPWICNKQVKHTKMKK